MMEPFRVGISSDFYGPDGTPAFPDFDVSPLRTDPKVEVGNIPVVDGVIRADDLAGFDAMILLGGKCRRDSLPGDGRLAMVARFGVGYDNVDIEACTDNGIAAVITPDGVRRPVAVAIMTLIMALTGKLLTKDRLTRGGPDGWAQKSAHMGVGLVGKTLGSVGIGNIGAEMFRLAAPFDMKFMAYDPYADAEVAASLGVRIVDDLVTLFREADIVTVNCPWSKETEGLVSAELLGLMKPSAYIVNTARGPIIDQRALTDVLQAGRIAGAGLDVLAQEPPDADDPILKLDNVVFSPHALCWTDQCFAGIGAADVRAVQALMRGEPPVGIVNRAIVDDAEWRRKLAGFRARFGAS